jgi:hypothetical protein
MLAAALAHHVVAEHSCGYEDCDQEMLLVTEVHDETGC